FQALNSTTSLDVAAAFLPEGGQIYMNQLQAAKTDGAGRKTIPQMLVFGSPQYAQAQAALPSLGISHTNATGVGAHAGWANSSAKNEFNAILGDAVIAILTVVPVVGQGVMILQIVRAGNNYSVSLVSEEQARALAPVLGFQQADQATANREAAGS